MPEKRTIKKAQELKRKGKSPSTQAGEFVREVIHHIREGKHGAKNAKQAIAIGLSEARRAGVNIPDTPGKKTSSSKTGKKHIVKKKTSSNRSKTAKMRLKKYSKNAVSHKALSRHAKSIK
ncbi:MAG: DUF6496 domain-containing protein [Bacteriovorax sp.]|nr:DUF6496 domain-containing protein [Bacteriovorax sp.]